jgi:hypothetical protein
VTWLAAWSRRVREALGVGTLLYVPTEPSFDLDVEEFAASLLEAAARPLEPT